MEKIRIYSKILKIIFRLAMVFVIIMPVIAWILYPVPEPLLRSIIGSSFDVVPQASPVKILYPMTWQIKTLAAIVDLIPALVLAYVMYLLSKLFLNFEKGKIFEFNNVKIIRRVGIGLIIQQLLTAVSGALSSGILTAKNPPGYGLITVTFSGTNISVVLLAVAILLVASIFLEAVKLREENQQFV